MESSQESHNLNSSNKVKNKIILFIGIALLLSLWMNSAIAYTIPGEFRPINEPFDIGDELETTGAAGGTIVVLQIIAGGLLYFASPVAVIFIVVSAFTMVTGGADSEKIEQSKKSLTWAVIGLLVIILSYSIVRAVISTTLKAASG